VRGMLDWLVLDCMLQSNMPVIARHLPVPCLCPCHCASACARAADTGWRSGEGHVGRAAQGAGAHRRRPAGCTTICLQDDLRKIYSHLKAPRFDPRRPVMLDWRQAQGPGVHTPGEAPPAGLYGSRMALPD
jgi:hypothetical protein